MFVQAYGVQEVKYSVLNMLDPWEVSLLGGMALLDVTLLSEVCHCGGRASRSHINVQVLPVWSRNFS